jgi:hypothetical protein
MYSEDVYSDLNCHNVAKQTEFCLGWLRFNVTSTGNPGCVKKLYSGIPNVTVASVMKTFTLKGVYTIHRSTPHSYN